MAQPSCLSSARGWASVVGDYARVALLHESSCTSGILFTWQYYCPVHFTSPTNATIVSHWDPFINVESFCHPSIIFFRQQHVVSSTQQSTFSNYTFPVAALWNSPLVCPLTCIPSHYFMEQSASTLTDCLALTAEDILVHIKLHQPLSGLSCLHWHLDVHININVCDAFISPTMKCRAASLISSSLYLCRQSAAKDILFSSCLRERVCMCDQSCTGSLLALRLINHSWEFHQIYNFGAVGNKDELVGFWGHKVKGQGHDEMKYGQVTCSKVHLSGKGIAVYGLLSRTI